MAGAESVSPKAGVDEREIKKFEESYSVEIPSDLRFYFRKLNGMSTLPGHDFDKHGYGFLSLSAVHSVGAFSSALGWTVDQSQMGLNTAFVFIDYFQWSCAYAFETAAANWGGIYLLEYSKARIVAPSFSSFIERYLADDRSLYEQPLS